MSDIRVVWDPAKMVGDWILSGNTLDSSNELVTAVAVALFTHRTAEPDDVLPDPSSIDRRGCWSDHDAAEIHGGWPVGSRLWLLSREKQTEETRNRADQYIREAIDPLIEIGLAEAYTLNVEWFAPERLGAHIIFDRGVKGSVEIRFERLWEEIA